ncbi:MAG: zinc-ribbon domain containing protein [Chloroflexi bacterium]|nr:zinc-ribbon domain containing protein [Chloroflexota bacterium]
MSPADKTLQCVECGQEFVFTVAEQEFLASKGYVNQPKRCPNCRQARRDRRGSGGGYGSREMYPAVCASCGKETQVPFQPRQGRPVYCDECFAKVRSTSGER